MLKYPSIVGICELPVCHGTIGAALWHAPAAQLRRADREGRPIPGLAFGGYLHERPPSIAALCWCVRRLAAFVAHRGRATAADADKPGAEPPPAAGTAAPPPADAPAPRPGRWWPTPSGQLAVELPGKTYRFVGLRYRGIIVPKFMMNLFGDGGRTVYVHDFGPEFVIRKDGFEYDFAMSTRLRHEQTPFKANADGEDAWEMSRATSR